ncbi:pilus motility taxis protein HmpF [Pannus brasiliensis CCIBt3594]|uniref:Pilus motility taxis protein HmpF n=1 Tax=Pannus brasiliensis CCIBt3594 TaxID=1427578 RepID=A0AAW9QXY5_9CHRO
MLYLAEVKKQTRGFIGGFKTELKLLACQHNDQTWSAIPNDETLSCDDTTAIGEGTLLLVNVGNNRQIQGSPEPAGAEIVRQLQKISRLMERGKEDQEKIEQWKQSLTYQSEILNRQKMEMEARLEQIEQMEAEFEYLERQRKELETLKKQLEEQQRLAREQESRFGLPQNLSPAQAVLVESLIDRLTDSPVNPQDSISRLLEAARRQQKLLETHWHSLEERRRELARSQEESDRLSNLLEQRSIEVRSTRESIETAREQLKIQETILAAKQELLGRIDLTLQTIEEAREMATRLARGEEPEGEAKIDIEALENLPIHELEEIVKKLKEDLDRLMAFVNDQEEELTIQCQAVEELEAKLARVAPAERSALETEIAEEQERKRMLDETLVGQRRNLRERQAILAQHLKVLRRARGEWDTEGDGRVKIEPLLVLLTERRQNTIEERQRLEREIELLQENLQPLREMIESGWSEQERKTRELEEQERQSRSIEREVTRLTTLVQFYESLLQPIQDRLDEILRDLPEISRWFMPVEENGHNLHPFLPN